MERTHGSYPSFRELDPETVDGDGHQLNVSSNSEGLSDDYKCFSYPGIFVSVPDAAPFDYSKLIALALPVDTPGWTDFMVPDDLSKLNAVSAQASNSLEVYLPVDLGDVESVFVRLPRRSWERHRAIELQNGCTVEYRAGRSGALTLHGGEFFADKSPRAILRNSSGEIVAAPWIDNGNSSQIDGLKGGDYTAYLTVGASMSALNACSEIESVRVESTENTVVNFRSVAIPTAGRKGWLNGSLAFKNWNLVKPWFDEYGNRLCVEPICEEALPAFKFVPRKMKVMSVENMDGYHLDGYGDPTWTWDAGLSPVGRYRIHVEPLEVSMDVEVRDLEATHVDLPVNELGVTLIHTGQSFVLNEGYMLIVARVDEDTAGMGTAPPTRTLNMPNGDIKMITGVGDFNVSLLWDGVVYSKELNVKIGLNSLAFDVASRSRCTVRLATLEGEPFNLTHAGWRALSMSCASGLDIQVEPVMDGKKSTRANIYSAVNVRVAVSSEFVRFEPSEFDLVDGSDITLTVVMD